MTPAQLTALLGPLDGARIPGGCQHCDAYQTATPETAGVWTLTIHHNPWCPWLTARTANRATRRAHHR